MRYGILICEIFVFDTNKLRMPEIAIDITIFRKNLSTHISYIAVSLRLVEIYKKCKLFISSVIPLKGCNFIICSAVIAEARSKSG